MPAPSHRSLTMNDGSCKAVMKYAASVTRMTPVRDYHFRPAVRHPTRTWDQLIHTLKKTFRFLHPVAQLANRSKSPDIPFHSPEQITASPHYTCIETCPMGELNHRVVFSNPTPKFLTLDEGSSDISRIQMKKQQASYGGHPVNFGAKSYPVQTPLRVCSAQNAGIGCGQH